MTANLLAVATVVSDGALLDLALDAFADGGYEGTSVRELCRRLGVSHNLVHERYGSKELLWYAAIDHGFRRLAADLAAAATAALAVSSDEIDSLRAILVRYVEVTADGAVPGTFSSTVGSYGHLAHTAHGRRFLEKALANYDAVVGYDHHTLSEDPRQNAAAMLKPILAPLTSTIVGRLRSRGRALATGYRAPPEPAAG